MAGDGSATDDPSVRGAGSDRSGSRPDGAASVTDRGGTASDCVDGADESRTWPTVLAFLVGVACLVGGATAFLADLVTGHDVLRSLTVNAVGAVFLVAWAARITYRDPESRVDSRLGAARTATLLVGAYLLLAAAVVGLASVRHGRPWLAVLLAAVALIALLVGGGPVLARRLLGVRTRKECDGG